MQHKPEKVTAEAPPRTVKVEVLRLKVGVTISIRSLSDEIGGCFTHWVPKRSEYCDPDSCFPGCAKKLREWKGYTAVEAWDKQLELWIPWVLEFTSTAHLDVRVLWRRGQVWQLSRPDATKKKKPAMGCRLIREDDPRDYPSAFGITPVLLALFRIPAIDLSARNPMPDRLAVEVSAGPPPIVAELLNPKPSMTPEQIRERIRDHMSANGKH